MDWPEFDPSQSVCQVFLLQSLTGQKLPIFFFTWVDPLLNHCELAFFFLVFFFPLKTTQVCPVKSEPSSFFSLYYAWHEPSGPIYEDWIILTQFCTNFIFFISISQQILAIYDYVRQIEQSLHFLELLGIFGNLYNLSTNGQKLTFAYEVQMRQNICQYEDSADTIPMTGQVLRSDSIWKDFVDLKIRWKRECKNCLRKTRSFNIYNVGPHSCECK